MRLAGRHALVSGSTKGIGLGIARAFVREGARVVIHSRNAADCAAVAKTLGAAAVPVAADLTHADEVRRLAAAALEAMDGRVDVLVTTPASRVWRRRRTWPRPTIARRWT